jgi:glucose-1-phosphate adenylyltransferase
MRLNDSGRVVGFLEKPKTAEEYALVRTEPAWIDAHGIPSRGRDSLASMGIYLFNRDTLIDVLTKTNYQDFGKEVFPASIRSRHVQVHLFDGYWEDIGTIRAFYDANLDLASSKPQFELTSASAPIYSRPRFLPPSRLEGVSVKSSLIADGCRFGSGCVVENSIIGVRCWLGSNVTIRNTIIMGADYFQSPDDVAADRAMGRPAVGVGDGTFVDGAIVDKNCRIGSNVRITNEARVENAAETPHGMICDGVVVIPKETTIPDNWRGF